LGIIQGFLDHAEDVRLTAMETLLEIAGQKKAPISLMPVSVIEYFMFSMLPLDRKVRYNGSGYNC
jgi:hypothetical protein